MIVILVAAFLGWVLGKLLHKFVFKDGLTKIIKWVAAVLSFMPLFMLFFVMFLALSDGVASDEAAKRIASISAFLFLFVSLTTTPTKPKTK